MKQEKTGWQAHQLNHMQIICTLLQNDNHASILHQIFYGPDALPDTQPKCQSIEAMHAQLKTGGLLLQTQAC